MPKYSKKVAVTLTESDYAKLESLVSNNRLTIGQLASTMVEQAITETGKTTNVTEGARAT